MKNISQLSKEGWIIQTKRGQTGQRAEYRVLFIESDLQRCQCITPCGKQGSNLLPKSRDSITHEGSPQSATASTGLLPKRRTNLTKRTSSKIDQVRFDFVTSKIPIDKRVQITSGTNYEFLLDELVDLGIQTSQIRDFLGSQNWITSISPGGLLLTTLRKYLVEMNKPRNKVSFKHIPPSSLTKNDQLNNALASLTRGMRLPD